MKHIIKAVKNLNKVMTEDPKDLYNHKKALVEVIDSLVDKTVEEMTWRGKYIQKEGLSEAKIRQFDDDITWYFIRIKPFERQLRDKYPDLSESFDKRAVLAEELLRGYK